MSPFINLAITRSIADCRDHGWRRISKSTVTQTQLQFPIEWTVQYGKGRVFVSTYGHVWANEPDPKGMHCAAFQTIMVRALKWLARRDFDPTAPKDFPSPDAISLRPWPAG